MVDDIQAIQKQIEQTEAQHAALKLALTEKQQAAKAGVLDQMGRMARTAGLTTDEIVAHFTPAKRTKTEKTESTKPAVAKPRAVWRDTITGGEYKGGKIPGWLADRLNTMGMSLDAYRQAGHMARVQ